MMEMLLIAFMNEPPYAEVQEVIFRLNARYFVIDGHTTSTTMTGLCQAYAWRRDYGRVYRTSMR